MISILNSRIDDHELDVKEIDFSIHHTDVLAFESKYNDYHVIANIPYYITSPILRHFIYTVKHVPQSMVILMQKILWWKKDKTSVLRLFVEKRYKVSEKLFVPKESFIPSPKVESSVLLFEKHDDFWDVDDERFLEIIKIGFAANRKKLIKNLVGGWFEKERILSFLKENDLPEMIRGEDLGIKVWCKLVKYLW